MRKAEPISSCLVQLRTECRRRAQLKNSSSHFHKSIRNCRLSRFEFALQAFFHSHILEKNTRNVTIFSHANIFLTRSQFSTSYKFEASQFKLEDDVTVLTDIVYAAPRYGQPKNPDCQHMSTKSNSQQLLQNENWSTQILACLQLTFLRLGNSSQLQVIEAILCSN